MMEYLKIVMLILGCALICAILSTNTINGIKTALGVDNKWINRGITLFINVLISYWFYFAVMLYKDILTYIVMLVLTCSGAETIYKTIGELNEVKLKNQEQNNIGEVADV